MNIKRNIFKISTVITVECYGYVSFFFPKRLYIVQYC